jgi:hypothetical protein
VNWSHRRELVVFLLMEQIFYHRGHRGPQRFYDVAGAGIGSSDFDHSDGMRAAARDLAGFSDSSELRG